MDFKTEKSGKEYIKSFCNKYDYPKEAQAALVEAFETLFSSSFWDEFLIQIELYDESYDQDFKEVFKIQADRAKDIDIHPYTLQFLYLVFLTPQLHKYYDEKGYSEDVYNDSVLDLKWKLLECKTNYDVWGTFVAHWTIELFKLKIFGMGRLQFEPNLCLYDYSDGDLTVQKGDIVLDTHIPSCGPLKREDCLKSYQKAEVFFANYFKNRPTVFSCNSWLLYPENKLFLPSYSRILEFADDYRIVHSGDDPSNSNAWRIFNTREKIENPEDYPQESSLQRAFVSWLKQGGTIGNGYGLMFFKNGKIINKE